MLHYSLSPKEMFHSIFINRYLIKKSIQREVIGRYKGSVLGIFWSFFTPLFMLGVYTFVFSVVFRAKWGGDATGTRAEFALILFAGLIIFNLFAECINSAPSLILWNTSYVKKVVYPLEILPVVKLGGTLFHSVVSLLVWLISYFFFIGLPHITILYLPLVLIPLCLFTLGLSWWLASIGVFLRDVSQVIGILVTALMFLSPIFYSVSMLPERYRVLLYLNPLTPIIAQARDVMFWGKNPDWAIVFICYAVSSFVAWGGFAWFQKTRKGFADVL